MFGSIGGSFTLQPERLQKAAACYNQILNLNPEYPELWGILESYSLKWVKLMKQKHVMKRLLR